MNINSIFYSEYRIGMERGLLIIKLRNFMLIKIEARELKKKNYSRSLLQFQISNCNCNRNNNYFF